MVMFVSATCLIHKVQLRLNWITRVSGTNPLGTMNKYVVPVYLVDVDVERFHGFFIHTAKKIRLQLITVSYCLANVNTTCRTFLAMCVFGG